MYKLLISTILFVLLSSCNSDYLEPTPDYMFKVFSDNEQCLTEEYIKLNIEGRTVVFSDTMSNVSFTKGIYKMNRQASLGNIRFNVRFVDDSELKNGYRFAIPGSYKFYDAQIRSSSHVNSSGVMLSLSEGTRYSASLPGSAFFYVTGRQKNGAVNICGSFDVLMGSDSLRVTGEYSLLYTDRFF